jgi:hypothetical protein
VRQPPIAPRGLQLLQAPAQTPSTKSAMVEALEAELDANRRSILRSLGHDQADEGGSTAVVTAIDRSAGVITLTGPTELRQYADEQARRVQQLLDERDERMHQVEASVRRLFAPRGMRLQVDPMCPSGQAYLYSGPAPQAVVSPADLERIKRALELIDPPPAPGRGGIVGWLPKVDPGDTFAHDLYEASFNTYGNVAARSPDLSPVFFGVDRGNAGRLAGMQTSPPPPPPDPPTDDQLAEAADPTTPGERLVELWRAFRGCHRDRGLRAYVVSNPNLPTAKLRELLEAGDLEAWLNPAAELEVMGTPDPAIVRGALGAACDAVGMRWPDCCRDPDDFEDDYEPPSGAPTPAEVFAECFAKIPTSEGLDRAVLEQLARLFAPPAPAEASGG